MLIELTDIVKIYNQGEVNEVRALEGVHLSVAQGTMVCLKGASGSGKSTLLSIIGCIYPPTSGRAVIAGTQLARLPDRFLTIHRRQTIGFIFQHFNILPRLSVLENIILPLMPLGFSPARRRAMAEPLLERYGIHHRRNFPAGEISGGELQRVAIARALINDPPIIIADEPTAHLDTHLSKEFLATMRELKGEGKTIIIASHDPLVTEDAGLDRLYSVQDGRVCQDVC
ncbi:MAG: ABC transporter ATP-binding protein [Desulfurivibrionaceae bacterium]|nr:ABC transporter ATP-binding protein [Desulfurivibrionaceae bacterium]